MNSTDYLEFLERSIKPWAHRASGGRVVNCRCFYCSDSKNSSHGHFYISIPQSDDEPSLYYCQKCKSKGIVTSQKLMDWGAYDTDVAVALTKHNVAVMKNPANLKYNNTIIYDLKNNSISDDELTRYKLSYINKRLGAELTYQDCLDLKILLNMGDLFRQNPYVKPTRDQRIIEALDANFVGFISHDNAFVNLRNLEVSKNLHESINKRYVNYNIFGKYDNTCRFYSIPSTVDLSDPRPIKLHVAEGSFDILSIYLNLRKTSERDIYSAVGGSGYKGLIKYFVSRLATPNLEIHLYPDNDVSRYTLLDTCEYFRIFNYPCYIHRNMFAGEKDFGVPVDRIKEVVERV